MSSNSMKAMRAKRRVIESTQKIIDAMRLIYATRFRMLNTKFDNTRLSFEQFSQMMENIWLSTKEIEQKELHNGLLRRVYRADFIDLQSTKSTSNILIVITSNKSLCGGFNNAIIKFALENLKKEGKTIDNKIICIGEKGAQHFSKNKSNCEILDKYTIPKLKEFQYTNISKELIQPIMDHIANIKPKQVNVVYSHFHSAIDQQPRIERLFDLPFSDGGLREREKMRILTPNEVLPYIMDIDTSEKKIELLSQIGLEYLEAKLYQTIFHTTLGEYAARMITMENAANNSKEILEDLRLQYNSCRQGKITQELIEVIAGSEAV